MDPQMKLKSFGTFWKCICYTRQIHKQRPVFKIQYTEHYCTIYAIKLFPWMWDVSVLFNSCVNE